MARTLQYQSDLERAVAAIKGASQKLQTAVPNRAMRLLLLYDLLLGSGRIDGGGKASRAVKELKEPLAKFLAPVRPQLRHKLPARQRSTSLENSPWHLCGTCA